MLDFFLDAITRNKEIERFSQQYSQVLLNKSENLKCLKFETKEKMKNKYIDAITYINVFPHSLIPGQLLKEGGAYLKVKWVI